MTPEIIFVGGTGRSGTTIVNHYMSCHQDVYATPIETKFIVEIDGLSDYYSAMTLPNYSVTHIAAARERTHFLLTRLMNGNLEGASPVLKWAYRSQGHTQGKLFPEFNVAVREFWEKTSRNIYVENPEELRAHMKKLILDIFTPEATRRGRKIICEKTPTNCQRVPFLRSIFPNMRYVNCMRDPRDIYASLYRLGWVSTGDLESGLKSVQATLASWVERSKEGDYKKQDWFYEIQMEKLSADPIHEMQKLADSIGLSPFSETAQARIKENMNAHQAKPSQQSDLPNWMRDFDKQQQSLINKYLEPIALVLGYK